MNTKRSNSDSSAVRAANPVAPAAIAFIATLAIGLVSSLAGPALGKSFPAPRPLPPPIVAPPSAMVEGSTRVDARLDGLILQVECEQTFRNVGGRQEEVEILLPVPADAVVTDGLLMADGREYPAEVLPADQARRIYEEIVRSRRDPALIELVGHGLIRLSAFPIPPGGTRTVSFRYHMSVAAREGRARLLFPVAALCGLNRIGPLDLDLEIEGRDPLAQLYSPSHDVEIEREGPTAARLRFATDRPNPHETLEIIAVRDARPIGVDLRTARGHGEDGYFLLAVSPGWDLLTERESASKTIIFVLDTSGSMEGEKFEQSRRALRRMIEEISPRDRFNIVAFAGDVEILFPEGPSRATDRSRERALDWIDRLEATGGTAIAAALDEAAGQVGRSGLVLFLTDGRPTVGEQDPEAILGRARIDRRAVRFYAFGVGYDVDARLLDDLARQGGGSVSYVRPGEDVDEAVTALRHRVERPCARNVRLEVAGVRIHDVYPEGPRDLFAGEPLIFAGRVKRNAGPATVRLTAEDAGGERLSGSWRVDFGDPEARSSSVPVLWASRRAASLLERIRREGHDPFALAELRDLSRRYGILNEEVALLAREDEPMLADGSVGGARDLAARQSPAPSTWGAVQSAEGLHLRGGRGAQADSKKEVDLSAKLWSLSEARTKSMIEAERPADRDDVTAGEVSFRRDGEWWTDARITPTLPSGTETIRLRTYGAAYFELARDGGKLAAWLSIGDRVRVLLPGILLEIAPDGEEKLPSGALERIRAAVRDA